MLSNHLMMRLIYLIISNCNLKKNKKIKKLSKNLTKEEKVERCDSDTIILN